jgi:hypothetical protein
MQQTSKYLMPVLNTDGERSAYRAFTFIVYHAILNSPGQEIVYTELLRHIRLNTG